MNIELVYTIGRIKIFKHEDLLFVGTTIIDKQYLENSKYKKELDKFIRENFPSYFEKIYNVMVFPSRYCSTQKYKDRYFYKNRFKFPEKSIIRSEESDGIIPEGFVQVICIKNKVKYYFNVLETEYSNFKKHNKDLPFMCDLAKHELIETENLHAS